MKSLTSGLGPIGFRFKGLGFSFFLARLRVQGLGFQGST